MLKLHTLTGDICCTLLLLSSLKFDTLESPLNIILEELGRLFKEWINIGVGMLRFEVVQIIQTL